MVTFNPGLYGGWGWRFGMPDGHRGTWLAGLELTVNRGRRERSHFRDDFFVYPVEGHGASLGWTALVGDGAKVDVGPLYLEGHRFHTVYGAGVGYAVDPDGFDHGPQASAWFGPYYLRARYLFDGGFAIFLGGQIKIPLVWIQSR